MAQSSSWVIRYSFDERTWSCKLPVAAASCHGWRKEVPELATCSNSQHYHHHQHHEHHHVHHLGHFCGSWQIFAWRRRNKFVCQIQGNGKLHAPTKLSFNNKHEEQSWALDIECRHSHETSSFAGQLQTSGCVCQSSPVQSSRVESRSRSRSR